MSETSITRAGRRLWRRLQDPKALLLHTLLVAAGLYLAFLLRFDFALTDRNVERLLFALPLLVAIRLPLFAYFKLFEGMWQFFGFRDLLDVVKAVGIGSVIFSLAMLFVYGHGFPRSVLLLEGVLTAALVSGIRLAQRAVWEARRDRERGRQRRALVVGAGNAGEMLIRQLSRDPSMGYEAVAIIDDDPGKMGRRVHGIEVVGPLDRLPELCSDRDVDEVLIAVPSATIDERRRILELCRAAGVVFRTVPDINELLRGRARIDQLQEVVPEDLLGREAIQLDTDSIRAQISGRTVLVTGAAGSIGSELCRQLGRFRPGRLVLLDRAESPLHLLGLELRRLYPELDFVAAIGDIQNAERVDAVLTEHSPEVIYHAAAYKHVHLMEEYPIEAIRNNVFGTETLARAALQHGASKLVLISTDKAVRPVGIMGMTKRLAEDLLLSFNGASTTFVAVRFGNVLGSQGSVLPIFKWQIANGGPVTVTDPGATRYFMLIPEAAQLVIQAAAMGTGGEVYFLDMGEPVRIIDLAENLIKMAGFEPGKDIDIRVTGLKPGERLNEELVKEQEVLSPTAHEKVARVENMKFDDAAFREEYEELRSRVLAHDGEAALRLLKEMAGRF